MNNSIRQDDLNDINSRLQKEMDIIAEDLSTEDYKVNINVMGGFVHISSEIREGIDSIDPTDDETNRQLFHSWREYIIEHIIEALSDLNAVKIENRVYLHSKNIMLYISYDNIQSVDYLMEYRQYVSPPVLNESRQLSKGEQPYVLSCLEYVAIRLNNLLASMNKIEGLHVLFQAYSKDDTITIFIGYKEGDIHRETIDRQIGIAQKMVLSLIAPMGWDSWVKIIVEELNK